jgi:hypothetical protein
MEIDTIAILSRGLLVEDPYKRSYLDTPELLSRGLLTVEVKKSISTKSMGWMDVAQWIGGSRPRRR